MILRRVLALVALGLLAALPACSPPEASTPDTATLDATATDGAADSGRDGGPPRDTGVGMDGTVNPDAAVDDAGEDAAVEPDGGEDASMSDAGCASAADCDDTDECTLDGCDLGACTHTAVDPDDLDVCTTDACDPTTGVTHTAVSTDDSDVCTTDACDPTSGVSHTAIANCCVSASECTSGVCSANLCRPAECGDGVLNGSETSIDCGGDVCGGCAESQVCLIGADCLSNACVGGVCVQCIAASTCPSSDTECRARTCIANVCGVSFTAAGTVTATQTAGDCQSNQCNGAGAIVSVAANTDLPVDGIQCTSDVCTAGVPTNPFISAGGVCSQSGGSVCDGAGSCVQCLVASTCAGTDTECRTRTCTAGACGFSFTAAGTTTSAQTMGDCQSNQCNGAGAIVSVAAGADVPVDGLECTNDVCTGATPSNPPRASGSACSMGGTVCNGSGACVACVAASTCPGTDTECQTRTCSAGMCGFSFTAAGTATSSQTAGDCHRNQCNGAGAIVSANDDTDVSVDANQCTNDICTAGTPSHPPSASGTACTQSGGVVCDGTGACVACVVASTCPGADTECQVRSCTAGTCGFSFTASGTTTSSQTPGDCHTNQCNGAGAITNAIDNADVSNDGNQCTSDICTAGVPSNPSTSAGTACSQSGGVVCDGSSACVQCLAASGCPGMDTECQTRTCSSGTCGASFTAAGTPVSTQTAGDCQQTQCNGGGSTVSTADNADVPADDGNQCTGEVCTAGTPSHPALAAGTACNQNGGTQCDGAGSCVPPPSVASTTPADSTSAVATTSVAVTFSTAMNPATLTGQTAAGACSGSIQVSLDGFASCIAFSSAAAAMTGGNTVATFSAVPGLLVNRTYQIRVTTAAAGAGGLALAAQFTTATGFMTGSPDLCAGSVVISQVYGGGGNASAPYTNDYVVLHNRGASPVTMTNWSVQYAGAAGSAWSVTPVSGTIAAGGYFLIQEAAGAGTPAALPTPDATGTIAMGATGGKVALVNDATMLTGACPTGAQIVDFVGFGSMVLATGCWEGSASTAAPSNTTAVLREQSGCADVNDNAADFATGAPTPRNSSSPAVACACAVRNESGAALEADYCTIQSPLSLSATTATPTALVYGQLYEAGTTEAAGANATVRAQLGFGPATANPEYEAGWSWTNASYNVQVGNNDEYQASFTAPAVGSYRYAYRFSLDSGVSWTMCDANTGDGGAGSNAGLTFDLQSLPVLTVTP